MTTTSVYQQIEMFGRDLPDHIGKMRLYQVSGLDEATAASLEDRAAKIITLGRRAILEIGNELLQARKEAKHGTWGAFLARCGMAERTAQNYINVAEKFGDRPEVLKLLRPTALYALAADRADQAAVETIIADAQAGQTPTVAEVQQKVRGRPRSSWLHCATCNAAVTQLYGARGLCATCWQSRTEPTPAAPAPEPTPAPVTATTYASAAEGHLLDAQNAGPGSTPRGVALQRALLALPNAPEPERAALTIRYHELRAEHAAAILRNGNTDLAGILNLMGWQYVQRRDGGVWHDPSRQHEVTFLPGELPIAARVVLERPEIGAEALCRMVEAAFSGREPEAAPAASITSVEGALEWPGGSAPPPADIPADIVAWAAAYGLSALPATADDDEPAFHLCWPGENPAGLIPFNPEWAREWLSGDAPDLVANGAPQSLYCRALAAGLEIVGADSDGRLAVAAVRDPGAPNSWLTPAELESRLGSPPPEAAAPSRADMAQWIDLCDQATNAYRSGDGAHALRCLWQMATIAAGGVRDARAWAARNAE